MAEFAHVLNEYNRMCDRNNGNICLTCPINDKRDGDPCTYWVTKHPELAERIIMDWANNHKSNLQKFEEVFGFTLHHKFCVSGDAVAWLNEEYKGRVG